jgi:hypothetical protein
VYLAQHDHSISVPVHIGPLVLRLVLLAAVAAVAGFALLRAFLPEPDRRTRVWITVLAGVAVLLESMLAAGFDLPTQAIVVVLVALAVPTRVAFAGPAVRVAGTARALAPWVLSLACGAALVEFARAWLGGAAGSRLPTGLILGLTGLAWVTFALPRSRWLKVMVQLEAAVLAVMVVAGAGQATAGSVRHEAVGWCAVNELPSSVSA